MKITKSHYDKIKYGIIELHRSYNTCEVTPSLKWAFNIIIKFYCEKLGLSYNNLDYFNKGEVIIELNPLSNGACWINMASTIKTREHIYVNCAYKKIKKANNTSYSLETNCSLLTENWPTYDFHTYDKLRLEISKKLSQSRPFMEIVDNYLLNCVFNKRPK